MNMAIPESITRDPRVIRGAKLAGQRCGSRPWSDDEKFTVGECKLVYVRDPDGKLRVCMPGGGKYTPEELKSLGYRVSAPRRLREGV